MAILNGKAKYAWITNPNTKFQPTYTINLIVDDDTANDFASRGHKVKQEDEGMAIIIRRKVDGPNGMKRAAPRLFDMEKNEIDVQIGNGSEVRVQYNEYEGENQFGPYKGLDLQAVQVVNLVAAKVQDGDELLSDGEEF